MKNILYILGKVTLLLMGVFTASFFSGCDYEIDLPEAGSKKDTTLPTADFSYASSSGDFMTIDFTDLSSEGTIYLWDFGGGNTSTEQDPSFTFTGGEGTYEVTLTVSDANGESDTITKDVVVVEGPYQPVIREAGFEDNTLPGGTGDGRDSWRVSWATIFGISGSPVTYGSQAAKLEATNARAGYQEIVVEAETNYDLRFWYTMNNNSSDPWAIVSAVGVTQAGGPGFITSKALAIEHTLASITVTDTENPSVYVQDKLSFNSGTNTVIGIYFYNDANVEARFDNFTIDVGAPGAVPPSAGFSSAQSESNYLEYSFTNSSTNATSYIWNFGDGMTSSEENPTHTYSTGGVYTVTLTAKNDLGKTGVLSKNINIQSPVTADFTYMVDNDNYRKIAFTDASEGAVSLLWEFGDGYQFTGMNPTHTYDMDGIFTVTLTATSITGNKDVATEELTVAEGFIVQVLNGTFDEYTFNTGDNADAWDMTPPSTVQDNGGNTVASPYQALWNNTALNAANDLLYGSSNEQPGSTSDGNNGTRGAKFSNQDRRLYQVVQVQSGVEYTFSIDTRSEAMGINTEVFLLNTEIADESGINASTSDAAIDAYFDITNDFNSDVASFTTSSFSFTPTTNQIVIYVRALLAVDGANEVFLDNVVITEN